METMNKEEIRTCFVDYVIKHSLALDEGNTRKANQYHKKIRNLYHIAKEQNYTKEVFGDLLNNSNEAIRLWSAGFCLKIYPDLATKVLIEISKSLDPMRRISAQATLEFYEKGQWDKLIE